MSSKIWYRTSVAVPGNLAAKVIRLDNVSSSQEKGLYNTTSPDENCTEFDSQMDRINHVDSRPTFSPLKLKFVSYFEIQIMNEVKKERKQQAKTNQKTEEKEETPVHVVKNVNNILHSILSLVEVYIIKQESYNSNGLYAHKSYTSKNFKWTIFDYKGAFHCEKYDYDKLPDEIMDASCLNLFPQGKWKCS